MEADFVIVGGGTAGCVLANRLSADSRNRVLVLEAGGEARSPWMTMPAGAAKLYMHPRFNWRYWTEPEPGLSGRKLYWPRGKALGGTSIINGMTYVRGNAADFDDWVRVAGEAWSWPNVLPYFRKFEDSPDGDPAFRGKDGPFAIGRIASPHPLSQMYLASAVAAGVAANPDYNGASQDGIGFTQVMMRNGVRVSALTAYLEPVRARPNLQVLTDSPVRRVLFEQARADGVEFERGGQIQRVRAKREVILCSGTVASPQLLLLSGIGDARALTGLGIPVVADRVAVGRGMQEHVGTQLHYRTRLPSYNRDARGWRLAWEVARYALTRRGLLTATASQVNGFVRISPASWRPDLQIIFKPASGERRESGYVFHEYQGVLTTTSLLHPRSRGHISLKSSDPHAPPAIVAGHLTDPADVESLIHGIKLLRRIFATEPLASAITEEVRPGASKTDDAALRDFVFSAASSMLHAVGTCAMGGDDAAVVTPDLRVRGVSALRVVDASVMPSLPSGNSTASVLMVAERASDLIRASA